MDLLRDFNRHVRGARVHLAGNRNLRGVDRLLLTHHLGLHLRSLRHLKFLRYSSLWEGLLIPSRRCLVHRGTLRVGELLLLLLRLEIAVLSLRVQGLLDKEGLLLLLGLLRLRMDGLQRRLLLSDDLGWIEEGQLGLESWFLLWLGLWLLLSLLSLLHWLSHEVLVVNLLLHVVFGRVHRVHQTERFLRVLLSHVEVVAGGVLKHFLLGLGVVAILCFFGSVEEDWGIIIDFLSSSNIGRGHDRARLGQSYLSLLLARLLSLAAVWQLIHWGLTHCGERLRWDISRSVGALNRQKRRLNSQGSLLGARNLSTGISAVLLAVKTCLLKLFLLVLSTLLFDLSTIGPTVLFLITVIFLRLLFLELFAVLWLIGLAIFLLNFASLFALLTDSVRLLSSGLAHIKEVIKTDSKILKSPLLRMHAMATAMGVVMVELVNMLTLVSESTTMGIPGVLLIDVLLMESIVCFRPHFSNLLDVDKAVY